MSGHIRVPSIPPEVRKAIVVWEKLLDAVAIIVIGVLCYFDKVEPNMGLAVIALLAGVNITDRMKPGGSGSGSGRVSGVVVGLGYPLIEVARRVKG